MAKGSNQKLKLYYLMKILLEKTDENHGMSMPEIMDALEAYEVTAERKSIYSDIFELQKFGIEVDGERIGKKFEYKVIQRQFELAELKLLVDSIQASKFITAKKTKEMIAKLETLCSEHEAKMLQRQVYVQGRIKAMNESIFYNVDNIYSAISENKKIKFQYYNWNIKKEMELRKNGEFYVISPWALTWDDENYYMIGFDSEAQTIKHYRVDKMLKISTVEEKREGKDSFKTFDGAQYAKKNFGMYSGEEEDVKIQFKNSMVGIFIDRFGKDIIIKPVDNDTSETRVKVCVSNQFFGWIFGLGDGVTITGPENVVNQMKKEAEVLYKKYK